MSLRYPDWLMPGLALAAFVGGALVLANTLPHISASRSEVDAVDAGNIHSISGGFFEASGVVGVSGMPGVLVVDDSRPRHVVWMELDESGRQKGMPKLVALGTTVTDPEDIASDGNSYYVVGSQSQGGGSNDDGLVRFGFDPARGQVERLEAIRGLRSLLMARVPELADVGKSGRNELNIEGLTWDSDRQRLLLGLRSPLAGRDAMIVPIGFQDPGGPFGAENLVIDPVLKIPLEGDGIRGLGYDTTAHSLLVIAGAPEYARARDFLLVTWSPTSPVPVPVGKPFPESLKPEGVTEITLGGKPHTMVVFDTSQYEILK